MVDPAWALPFVEEMAQKLEAAGRAESRGGGGRRKGERRRKERRRKEGRDTAHRSQTTGDRLSAAAGASPSRRSAQSPRAFRFYPADMYTIGLNEPLPFVRDHGLNTSRRQAPLTTHASPRRDLGRLPGKMDRNASYQSRGRSRASHFSRRCPPRRRQQIVSAWPALLPPLPLPLAAVGRPACLCFLSTLSHRTALTSARCK